MNILINASLEEKISKKSGNPYTCVIVELTDNLKKQVFLEPSEIEAIKLFHQINDMKKNSK